jgi:hypothetical protein
MLESLTLVVLVVLALLRLVETGRQQMRMTIYLYHALACHHHRHRRRRPRQRLRRPQRWLTAQQGREPQASQCRGRHCVPPHRLHGSNQAEQRR